MWPRAAAHAARSARVAARPAVRASSGGADDDAWTWMPPDRSKRAAATPTAPAPTTRLDASAVTALLEDEGAVDVETLRVDARGFCDHMVAACGEIKHCTARGREIEGQLSLWTGSLSRRGHDADRPSGN